MWWWPFRPEPPESVELSQVLDFQRHGVTMLRGLLTAELGEPSFAADFHGAVDAAEREFVDHALSLMGCPGMRNATEGAESALLACQARAEQAGEDAPRIPYVQYINLHRHSPRLLAIATSAKLGRAAAALLDVAGVRLYQSTAFIKPPGRRDPRNQETGWHPDLATVPLDTNDFGTFWCPLQPLARGDSVLAFAPGSHRDSAARFWYDRSGRSAGGGRENQTRWLEARHGIAGYDSYAAGDCSFHHGWTQHAAPSNRGHGGGAGGAAREALAVSFVDAGARLLDGNTKSLSNEDELSWEPWIDEVYEAGGTLDSDHPRLPLVWPRDGLRDGQERTARVGPDPELKAASIFE